MTGIINSGLDGLTTIRTSTDYTANDRDLVITDGQTVTLPDPTTKSGQVILIKPVNTDIELKTPTGQIADQTNNKAIYKGNDPLWLQSNGNNWYARKPSKEVRTGAGDVLFSAIPDSVVNQFSAGSFASPWADGVGTISMSLQGDLAQSTFSNGSTSVRGDGTDDGGLADVYDVGGKVTFGVAFTIESDGTTNNPIMGLQSGSANNFDDIWKIENSNGFQFFYRIANTDIVVESSTAVFDGSVHAVVVQMGGESASDVEIYVDDMTTDVSSVTTSNTVDTSQWDLTIDMGFYGINNNNTFTNELALDAGVFEFNTETYSETERQNFVSRRPEV